MLELQDARESVIAYTAQLEHLTEKHAAQLEHSIGVYGPRMHWPVASEMFVRDMETTINDLITRLADCHDYIAELSS